MEYAIAVFETNTGAYDHWRLVESTHPEHTAMTWCMDPNCKADTRKPQLVRYDPDDQFIQVMELEAIKEYMMLASVGVCKFCDNETPIYGSMAAHKHQNGWVCSGCWDERLRSTA